jgi:hypothetical protein
VSFEQLVRENTTGAARGRRGSATAESARARPGGPSRGPRARRP